MEPPTAKSGRHRNSERRTGGSQGERRTSNCGLNLEEVSADTTDQRQTELSGTPDCCLQRIPLLPLTALPKARKGGRSVAQNVNGERLRYQLQVRGIRTTASSGASNLLNGN